ncbi:MAG TPA: helix-turn-helix transcriptional regulator [Galbitalea sp.]
MEQTSPDFPSSVDEAAARNVKKARERAGYSQAELAQLMTDAGVPGIHQTTIARIENEKAPRSLRLPEVLVIARILNYRVEDLVESDTSAALRASYEYLRGGVEDFRKAGAELLFRKEAVARQLDEAFPFTWGNVPELADYVKVNPASYDLVDELLSSNSDLATIVDDLYRGVSESVHRASAIYPFEASRVMDLLSEALVDRYWYPLRDLSGLSDDEFQTRVLKHFDDATPAAER